MRVLAICAFAVVLWSAAAEAQITGGVLRIGVLNDQSGPYADVSGPGAVVAAHMAAEAFGGTVAGAKIEILSGDHQNKPDVGAALARRWLDEQGVAAIADVPTSSVAFAVQDITRSREKIFLDSGAAAADLSGRACSPFAIQTADDTIALSVGTASAAVASGLKSWFFLTADFAFGHAIQADATKVIEAGGGQVLGAVLHPPGTADFSSFLLRAQASGAQAIALANAGADTITSIKQAAELGIGLKAQRLVGLILFITDIHAIGLDQAQGLLLTAGFYWDMSDEARDWAAKFHARTGRMPTREQATTYATIMHYLSAVRDVGSDDSRRVMARMRAVPMAYFGQTGPIRADGRFVHDLALYQVKAPSASQGEWDLYQRVQTLPGEVAFGGRSAAGLRAGQPGGIEMKPMLSVSAVADPAAEALIGAGLDAFNAAKAGYWDAVPLNVLVHDGEGGALLGGLLGRTSLGLLFIDLVHLPDGVRGQNVGTRMMALAEETARQRGCGAGVLYTISFQAPGFYERLGWRRFGKIPCDPPGTSRIFLTKEFRS